MLTHFLKISFYICLEAAKLDLTIFEYQEYCCNLNSALFFFFKYMLNLDFRVHNDYFGKLSKLCKVDLILTQECFVDKNQQFCVNV